MMIQQNDSGNAKALGLLLDKLLCPINRRESEEIYRTIPSSEKFAGLVTILTTQEAKEARCWLAATLLRRVISSSGDETVKDEAIISSVEPLLRIYHTASAPIRKMVAHCISEIVQVLSMRKNPNCKDILQFLLMNIQNNMNNANHCASSLELLALLPSAAPVAFCSVATDIESLVNFVLLPTQPLWRTDTRLLRACMETVCHTAAAISIVQNSNSSEITEAQLSLQQLVQTSNHPTTSAVPQVIYLAEHIFLPLLHVIYTNEPTQDEDEAHRTTIIQLWLDTLPNAPHLFCHSETIQKYVFEIIRNTIQQQQEQKHVLILCLETICTLCQYSGSTSTKPSYLVQNYGTNVLDMLMQLLIDGVDENVPAWAEDEQQEQESSLLDERWDGDEEYLQDVEMIFVNFVLLGRNPSISYIVQKIQESKSNDWRIIRASLHILELLSECSPKACEPYFEETIQFALNNILQSGNNPRVLYQACQLIGSIAAICDEESGLAKYSANIISSLSQLLMSPCLKVVSHASLALISLLRSPSFANETAKDGLKKIMPSLWRNIQHVFGKQHNINNSSIRGIHLIACLADAMEVDFLPVYYKSAMTLLTSCIQLGTTAEQRGAALEAMTIVSKAASASEENVYKMDARNIMTMILPLLESYANNDKQQILVPLEQTLTSSARIASILEQDFSEFAPAVLPFLLQWATQELDVTVTDGVEDEADTEDLSSVTVSLPGIMGTRKVSLNTTQIQEKAQAARSIYEIANAMGAAFGPYAEPCVTAFLPLVGFRYSAEVRSTSAQALAPIFSSACQYAITAGVPANARSLPQQVFAPLVKSILKEIMFLYKSTYFDMDDIVDDLLAMADALSEIFFSAYHYKAEKQWCIASLDRNDSDELVATILSLLQDIFKERSDAFTKGRADDVDQDDLARVENHLSFTAQIVSSFVDCIGYILKSRGQDSIGIFKDRIVPFFGPKLTASADDADKVGQHAAICLFDDCVEHCGSYAAATYGEMLLYGIVPVLTNISTNDGELKAAAVYGVAQLARHAPTKLLESVARTIVPCLYQIAASQNEETDLSEGALSSLASMTLFPSAPCKNASTGIDPALILGLFLNAMPIQNDESEAQFCQEGLCSMIEAGEIDILSHTPALLRIIAQTICLVSDGEEVASECVLSRYSKIVKQMLTSVNRNILNETFESLESREQQALQQAASRG